MQQISTVLKNLVPKKGKNKSQVAAALGISSQLLGHYISGRHKPKTDFYQKWKEVYGEDLLAKVETNVSRGKQEEAPKDENDPNIIRGVDYHEKYIRSLEEDKERLLTVLESNLAGMRANQNYGVGILVELLERDVNREAKGNQGKKRKILAEIARKIGPDFDIASGKGIFAGDSNGSIH